MTEFHTLLPEKQKGRVRKEGNGYIIVVYLSHAMVKNEWVACNTNQRSR